MQKDIAPERLARLKRNVPKGMIKIEKLPPFHGETLQPVSVKELGVSERKAA
jgi:hypothetical protein